jgi:hypothetical protein
MGMGGSMMCLRGTVNTLEKTWQAWWDERDPKRRKKLRDNFEYLLSEAHSFLGYVDEEWRSAFPKPKRKPKYDQKLQHDLVNGYVPEYDRKKKA